MEGWNLDGVIVTMVTICILLAVGPGHDRRKRRPDRSIQGLLVNLGPASDLPLILTAGLPILVSVLLGSRVLSLASLSMAAAMVLTILLLLGSRAFFYYWFLVAGPLLLFLKHANFETSLSTDTPARYHTAPLRTES